MALDPEISRILGEQVQIFNQRETKNVKAQVDIPPSKNPGRGNDDYGRFCVYDVLIEDRGLQSLPGPKKALSISHPDGQSPFRATITVFSSGGTREEQAASPAQLAERLKEILAKEDWDA